MRSTDFRTLAADGLIDVGDRNADPVTITATGRAALSAPATEGTR